MRIYIVFLSYYLLFPSFGLAQELVKLDNKKFIKGLYGLQAPVGTKGYRTGRVDEVKKDLLSLVKNENPGSENNSINSLIAYRSWDRKNFPNWDFSGFFLNYMEDIYELTKNENHRATVQVLTPTLYQPFIIPAVSTKPRNDEGIDRSLDKVLFKQYVFDVLQKEYDIVKKFSTNDSMLIDILLSPSSRPLLGWYLDDEPIVANHDIQVIEEMARIIFETEYEFIRNKIEFNSIRDKILFNYHHIKTGAFDCDDLHQHPKSRQSKDGLTYNRDGRTYKLDGQRYTIFKNGTYDVLMPDFYQLDTKYWGKILNDIRYEFASSNIKQPGIMPVIRGFINKKYVHALSNDFYTVLTNFLLNQKVDGIWIYTWQENNKENITVKDLLKEQTVGLKSILRNLER